MATTSTRALQPTVEDYFSDDGHGQPAIEPFTPEPSPGKANMSQKRSHPDNMSASGTPAARASHHLEVKSDSGYSSQSVAGMSSADSAASAASSTRSPPAVAANPSPTPAPRRPAHSRQQSSQAEMRYTLPRRESHSSRPRPVLNERRSNPPPPPPVPKRRDSRNGECTTPACTECGPAAAGPRPRPTRRDSMRNTQPADSAPNVSYPHVYDTRSHVSDPAQYQAPSPREARPPRMYHTSQGGPVIQPGITRRLSVNTAQPRPTSYHGDPNYNWPQSGMHSPYPNMPQEPHGPPPSRSAWNNVPPYHQPQMNAPYMPQYAPQAAQANAYFQAAQQMQPREQQRPYMQPTSAYPYNAPPVVQVARAGRDMPSARYHADAPPLLAAQRPQQRIGYLNQEQEQYDHDSSSGSESESEEEPDLPPQRARRDSTQQRPRLRHAQTTPAPPPPEVRRPQTIVIPDTRPARVLDRNRDSRPARRMSTSRPPSIKSQSYDTPDARVFVEDSRSSRREQVYDRPQPRRPQQREYTVSTRPKRSSRLYESTTVGHDYERDYHDDDEEAEPDVRGPRRRRDTNTETRRRSHRPVEERRTADVEDYINASRGGSEPVADVSYAAAKKRSSRASAGPSEAESSRSRGSDNNGEIRLRVRNDHPVTLRLDGDMEGRTLQLVPIENEMNELVISSNPRGDSTYHRSDTRSVRRAPRAITSASQARRDAEEMMTERSSHSSRRRREEEGEPRRLLGRTKPRREHGNTEYRY